MVRVKFFDNANSFYQAIKNKLIDQEAEHNLILGLTRQIMDTPEHFLQAPIMGIVYDEGMVLLVCLMTPPRDLLLAACTSFTSLEPLNVLADSLWQKGVSIPGVNAEKQLSFVFAELWSHRGAFKPALKMKQRIYRLDQVINKTTTNGFMRNAIIQDRPTLILWTEGFLRESLGEDSSRATALVDAQLNKKSLYVWDDQGIVSMAAKSRETITGAVVSFVYTPQKKRKQGYATALVTQLSEVLLQQGYKFCALFTDLGNPTSNAIYQKIGYLPVMDFDRYEFSKDLG